MAVHLPPDAHARRDLVCYSAPNIDPDPLTHVLRSGGTPAAGRSIRPGETAGIEKPRARAETRSWS